MNKNRSRRYRPASTVSIGCCASAAQHTVRLVGMLVHHGRCSDVAEWLEVISQPLTALLPTQPLPTADDRE